MKTWTYQLNQFQQLLTALQNQEDLEERIEQSIEWIVQSLKQQKPLLVCGNGGSASDALHISGELVGRFLLERKALNVVCLSANTAVMTAWANDYDYETIFARQVEAHGIAGGILWGISTSGNSPNLLRAFETARHLGMKTIALTGQGGGKIAPLSDLLLDVPSRSTPRIQELHVLLYHYICAQIEIAFGMS